MFNGATRRVEMKKAQSLGVELRIPQKWGGGGLLQTTDFSKTDMNYFVNPWA